MGVGDDTAEGVSGRDKMMKMSRERVNTEQEFPFNFVKE